MAVSRIKMALIAGVSLVAVGALGTVALAQQGGWDRGGYGGGFERGAGMHGGYGKGRHGGRRGNRMRHMARLDANRDGEISREEVLQSRTERFEQWDTNGDGEVTEAELREAIMARMAERIDRRVQRMIRRFDKDRSGSVTAEEFADRALERFTWRDLNDDGKLSGDELPRRVQRMLERRSRDTDDRMDADEDRPVE